MRGKTVLKSDGMQNNKHCVKENRWTRQFNVNLPSSEKREPTMGMAGKT